MNFTNRSLRGGREKADRVRDEEEAAKMGKEKGKAYERER